MRSAKWKMAAAGGAVGILNGAFGGGGGMAVVPFLVSLGFTQKEAHATALLVILPVCLVSAVVYLFRGHIEMSAFLPVALGSTAGGMLGAMLLPRLGGRTVRCLFAALMFAAGARMLF